MADVSNFSRPRARRRPRRTLLFTSIIAIVLVLAFALVFAVAQGTRRITTAAEGLHSADEALRQATTVRAHLALSVIVANVDRELGTNSTDVLETSREESLTALGLFYQGVNELSAARVLNENFMARVDAFGKSSLGVLDLLEGGDSDSARALAVSELDGAFRDLQAHLILERQELDSIVSSADDVLSSVGNLARFLVAFLVPTAVIVVYRELASRQQRQIELEGHLQAEQALGKAREDFIANASHELRTPLTSIYGLALLLEEDPAFADSATARELLDMIISESADLSRMVEDLLTTARLDAGALHYAFENISVRDEIEEVVAPLVRSGVDVSVTTEPAIVRVDRLRFRQLLRNLLSNANKYGGPHIRVEGHVAEGKLLLAVADDGQGIPEEVERRLFQRFLHQGREPHILGSVGLGLSIVRALAEGMGGFVTYERIDGWTRFILALPSVGVAADSPAIGSTGPARAPEIAGRIGLAAAEEHRGWPT